MNFVAWWPVIKDVFRWLTHRRRKICLLVVEDNPTDSELLSLKIQSLGWECDCVASAEAAYPLLINKRHPVVLLDVRLPYESGTHLAGRIIKQFPECHVVLVAGELTDLEPINRGLYFGLIAKPVTPESLRDVFRKPKR